MLPPLDPVTPAPRSRRTARLLAVWAIALVSVIAFNQLGRLSRQLHLPPGPFALFTFLCALVLIAVTLYGAALIVRWLLRKLFWRVGRRLFLSYVMIGVFPFFLFAVLLLAISYMIAGVMSHAALRGERQASLGQLESSALEYSLTGKKPLGSLPSQEIYDTADASGAKLPEWLKKSTFSGMAIRKTPTRQALLVASRQFPGAQGTRTVVFVQPMDRVWSDALAEKSGMTVRLSFGEHTRKRNRSGVNIRVDEDGDRSFNIDGDEDDIGDVILHSVGRKIVWGDLSALNEWETGVSDDRHQLFTLIINPAQNLFHFYFGARSDDYLNVLLKIIAGLTMMLLFMYMLAAMFAAVLIFSITRAVNRIEKGTKAVERGDFSYRIAMRPHNQLGEMAQSFDRMTESIASLLTNVQEKERLQSEIAIAATIQRNLLPKDGPKFRGVSFAAHFEPTTSIGGDYYDVFNLDKSRLAVAIGDVSGHGLSTGLVMAMVKAAMTTLVEEGADEVSLFRRLNELVHRSTERRAFMTLAFTIFDLEKATIRHTNAGHLYPYLIREGQRPFALEVPSLPLGVRSDILTHTEETPLREGDAVVYLSDGIVEAQDESGEPFGFDALESLLESAPDRSPNALRDRILEAVAHHSGNRPADDDRTIMVLRFENFRTGLLAASAQAVEVVKSPGGAIER